MKSCSVCLHSDRATIDAELLRGTPTLRQIAARTALSKTALLRHKSSHIPLALSRAKDAAQIADASGLLNELQQVVNDCKRLQASAEKSGDVRGALQALATLGKQLETVGKLAVEIERQRLSAPTDHERAQQALRKLSNEELAQMALAMLPDDAIEAARQPGLPPVRLSRVFEQ